MAQLVERRLGKAEVGGSNPLGSSMETLEFSRVFCCFKGEKNRPGRAEYLERWYVLKNFNKLVRDKIPDIIREDGGQPRTEILSAASYISELDKKLDEEIAEYQDSKELEELADVVEVIYAICEARGYTVEKLHAVREEKRRRRGGFEKKILLVSKD